MRISDLNLPPFKRRDLHAVFRQGCVQKLSWRTFDPSMSLVTADRPMMKDWIAGGGPWTFHLLLILELPISQTYSRTSEFLTMEGLTNFSYLISCLISGRFSSEARSR